MFFFCGEIIELVIVICLSSNKIPFVKYTIIDPASIWNPDQIYLKLLQICTIELLIVNINVLNYLICLYDHKWQ